MVVEANQSDKMKKKEIIQQRKVGKDKRILR